MAIGYQIATIQGTGGFSKLFDASKPVIVGAVSCTSGDAWFRLVKNATATASGANATLISPAGSQFTDGWLHLTPGMVMSFGGERVSDTAFMEAVQQIDVYCTMASEVLINAH